MPKKSRNKTDNVESRKVRSEEYRIPRVTSLFARAPDFPEMLNPIETVRFVKVDSDAEKDT